MEFFRRLRPRDARKDAAARAVAETSAFITDCLRHPERATPIPVIPAGTGRFPPSLTTAFWEPVLQD